MSLALSPKCTLFKRHTPNYFRPRALQPLQCDAPPPSPVIFTSALTPATFATASTARILTQFYAFTFSMIGFTSPLDGGGPPRKLAPSGARSCPIPPPSPVKLWGCRNLCGDGVGHGSRAAAGDVALLLFPSVWALTRPDDACILVTSSSSEMGR